jgi:hypothetical protein
MRNSARSDPVVLCLRLTMSVSNARIPIGQYFVEQCYVC